MNRRDALEFLDINIDEKDIKNLDIKLLKKKYHKLALQYHPDKNNNNAECNEKFRLINESYEFLKCEIINRENYETNNKTFFSENYEYKHDYDYDYLNILKMFISEVIREFDKENNCKDYIKSIISDIVSGCKSISLKIIFEKLNKEDVLIVYEFLSKYRNILKISNILLDNIKEIIAEKYKNDEVIILNPSIDDLLDNNIYVLEINEKKYYVPLWHEEVYFDTNNGNEIVVKMIPELPNNIQIDENRNIIVGVDILFDYSLLDKELITINLGKKNFEIKLKELIISRKQMYIIKGNGLSEIGESNDIYFIEKRGNIIVNIKFVTS